MEATGTLTSTLRTIDELQAAAEVKDTVVESIPAVDVKIGHVLRTELGDIVVIKVVTATKSIRFDCENDLTFRVGIDGTAMRVTKVRTAAATAAFNELLPALTIDRLRNNGDHRKAFNPQPGDFGNRIGWEFDRIIREETEACIHAIAMRLAETAGSWHEVAADLLRHVTRQVTNWSGNRSTSGISNLVSEIDHVVHVDVMRSMQDLLSRTGR